MNDNTARDRQSSDNIEEEPRWPQRPVRPQPQSAPPRLEPPAGRAPNQPIPFQPREGSGRSTYRASVSSPAPEPSARPAQRPTNRPDSTKETQVLPVVESYRFTRGQGQATKGVPTTNRTPQSYQAVRPAQPAQHSVKEAPVPTVVPVPAQPQVRKPGGWQYERQDDEYENAQAYTPERQAYNRAQPDHSRSYLSVNIESGRKRRFGWLLWLLAGIVAVVVIIGVASALAWQGQYAGKIYGGISIMGIDVGGKSPDEARKMINDRLESFMSQPVVLTWRGKEWRPSAEQLGITFDVKSTVEEAFKVGRNANLIDNMGQQWVAAQSGYGIPLTVQVSQPAMQTYLQGLANDEIDHKLFEGDIRLNADKIEALPGEEGRTLRVYDAVQAIQGQVAKLEQGKVDLPVDTVQPSVSAQEVQYIQGLLQVRISSPITATAPTKTETLDRDAIIRFTVIERNPDRTAPNHIQLGWNDTQLKVLTDRWAQETTKSAQNARFAWNNGSVSVLSESSEGFEPDSAALIGAIKQAAGTSDARQFAMPGKVVTPTVSSKDIGALGIKEQIGQGVSTFKGSSPERATNIKVAANLLNGAVVAPGGTFSFLQQMGGIDESHGFVPGYVIAAERTQLGVGGGVCQVSTTTFRAAFWSGVKVTERNQHSYRVGWYEANGEPVGFDAAVFDPGVDLKFINDSPGYILIDAGATSDTLTVTFYGTKTPGMEVKLEGPQISNRQPAPPDVYQVDPTMPAGSKKQVETAHAGLNTLITRRIVVPGQPDKTDQFSSAYKPWPNWYIVASASQIPGGAQAAPNPTPNP